MILSDELVVRAELEGLRRLARLERPKVKVTQEDVPGASCIWSQPSGDGPHRDLVRLRPGSGVPLSETLQAVRDSRHRLPGGGLEVRGAASSFAGNAAILEGLGGWENLALPRALMARYVASDAAVSKLDPGFSVMIADDAASLADLRTVVSRAFTGADEDDGRQIDVEADFYHAPGVMTYLAIREGDRVICTGSMLVVDGVANIWSVATTPAARGRGAASAVIRAICHEAPRHGAVIAALRTSDDLARPGGLYRSVGFDLVGHERVWEIDDVDGTSMADLR